MHPSHNLGLYRDDVPLNSFLSKSLRHPDFRHKSGQEKYNTKNQGGGGNKNEHKCICMDPLHNPEAMNNCMLLSLSVFEKAHILSQ